MEILVNLRDDNGDISGCHREDPANIETIRRTRDGANWFVTRREGCGRIQDYQVNEADAIRLIDAMQAHATD